MQVARNVTKKVIFAQEKEHILLAFDNSCHHNIPHRAAMNQICLQ